MCGWLMCECADSSPAVRFLSLFAASTVAIRTSAHPQIRTLYCMFGPQEKEDQYARSNDG